MNFLNECFPQSNQMLCNVVLCINFKFLPLFINFFSFLLWVGEDTYFPIISSRWLFRFHIYLPFLLLFLSFCSNSAHGQSWHRPDDTNRCPVEADAIKYEIIDLALLSPSFPPLYIDQMFFLFFLLQESRLQLKMLESEDATKNENHYFCLCATMERIVYRPAVSS